MPNVEKLGDHKNQFADLIPNGAAQGEKIAELFLSHLKARNIPSVSMKQDTISDNGQSREFHFVNHRSGALMTIALRVYGNDLLVKWDTWFKGRINIVIVLICAACALLGLFFYVQGQTIFSIIGTAVFGVGVTILLNAFRKGTLFKKLDFLSGEDLTALQFATNGSIQLALDQVGIQYKLRELMNPNVSSGPMTII